MGRTFAILALATLAAVWAPAVRAGRLEVRVVDVKGKPIVGAVVTLRAPGMPAPRAAGSYRVDQHNTAFHPFVSVVPVGATVAFPNLDPFKHHVYSFSTAKKFELKLFSRDQTRSITLDKSGIVAIGCNIHDSMSAYIYVADTPWARQTDARGIATFADAPGRAATVAVWHPYSRSAGGTDQRAVAANETGVAMVISLRPAPMHRMGGY